jgi:FkbM family methyltransferase
MGMNLNITNNIRKKYLNKINNGVFIECGAVDGIHRSITKILYDNGWRGYNFEPNPITFKELENNRKHDTNLNLALSDKIDEISFYIPNSEKRGYKTGGGSLSKSFVEKKGVEFIEEMVKTITFDKFVEEYKVSKIDFMVLDVEGFELNVLSRIGVAKIKPTYLLVETAYININDLNELLSDHYREDNNIDVGWENKLYILKN